MKRLHLFEWEDQKWFPTFLRDYMTDFLQFVANQFDMFKGVVPVLLEGLQKSGSTQVIDLASGGGGSWKKLLGHLQSAVPNLKVMLSDYYPNLDAFEATKAQNPEVFDYKKKSINAMDVPKELKGLRTMFLSFHHFQPEQAVKILQDAVNKRQAIAVFEAQERSISHFIQFFFSPINVLLMTPFIPPFKIGRIFFTYLIPLVPILVWWDGLVSVLRTYSQAELRDLIDQVEGNEGYVWEVGKKKSGMVTVPYLLGYPS